MEIRVGLFITSMDHIFVVYKQKKINQIKENR